MKALLLTVTLLFTGCAPTLIMMKNPQTNEVAQCNAGLYHRVRASRNAEYCARTYENAGWERVPRF